MDAVEGLLDGPRARQAFLLRSVLTAPWAMRIQDEAPLTLVAVTRGEAWVLPDEGEPVALRTGDVCLVLAPQHYVVADDPTTAPQVVIHPGQVCTSPDGAVMEFFASRTWGNDPAGSTVLLTGTYERQVDISKRLLLALPPLVVLRAGTWDNPLVAYLTSEIARDEPGQQAVLDRVLDLLLIAVLRAWFARPEAQAPGWYAAHGDPVVGPALRLLHEDPAAPWTVASLASALAVSRAALARRFTELVGEPPMTYLTHWRLSLAADLLREQGATVDAVAHQVGYGSGFALSTAFKRVRGVSPQEHRRTA